MTKINLAGPEGEYKEVAYNSGVPWVMTSYQYHKHSPSSGSGEEWTLEYRGHENCNGIMMDSGAYSYISALSKKENSVDIDWWEFAEQYATYVRENEVKRYIGLDLDSLVGYEKTVNIREFLEDEVGWPPIPVWHPNRGKQAFRDMSEEYPRVALGGFPWREIPEDKWHVLPWFINEAHKRNARIHALGFQPTTDRLEMYPFDSTDSMNWKWAGIFGELYKWDGRRMSQHDHEGTFDSQKRKHNLREWVKYARYFDGKGEPDIEQDW